MTPFPLFRAVPEPRVRSRAHAPALAGSPRATFHVEAATGRRWWAFSGPAGRLVVRPETPGLRIGLSAVRMGETVVDAAVGRELLSRISSMEARVAVAEGVARTLPAESARQGLSDAIKAWWVERDAAAATIDRLKRDAQRAIVIRTWGSASDADLAALGRLEDSAFSLEERAHTIEAAAAPPTRPVTPSPPIPAPVTEGDGGLPVIAWVGIGAGALAAIGVLASVFSKSASEG